jgi:hypothetical protein
MVSSSTCRFSGWLIISVKATHLVTSGKATSINQGKRLLEHNSRTDQDDLSLLLHCITETVMMRDWSSARPP